MLGHKFISRLLHQKVAILERYLCWRMLTGPQFVGRVPPATAVGETECPLTFRKNRDYFLIQDMSILLIVF